MTPTAAELARMIVQLHRLALDQDERMERLEAAISLPGRVDQAEAYNEALMEAADKALKKGRAIHG